MEWPLVGRDEELEAADEALRAGGVVVAGAPGVGKTRLAMELVARAPERGWASCWAAATAAAQAIPFGAVAHLLPASLEGSATRANLLRAAADRLVEGAAGGARVLALGVDDAHLLDEQSAALLQVLLATEQARVVATVRTGQTCPDAVTQLWRDGPCPRLELQPLSRPEVAALVEVVLGGPVEGRTLHRLWEVSGGNPLFLRELLAGGRESGALREITGVWRWRGPGVPGRLTDVVEARLGDLTDAQRRTVEVIAVAEPVGVGVLERVVDLTALEAVERRGLVAERQEGRRRLAQLSHPIYGEVLRETMPPIAARTHSRRLAGAVEATGAQRREDLLRIGAWRLEAGEAEDPSLLLEAARSAVALQDHELAGRLARAAVDAGGGFDAEHLRAETLAGLGRLEEAEAVLSGLQPRAETDAERAQVAQTRALTMSTGLGDVEAALAVLRAAEEDITDAALRTELVATRAYLLWSSGSLREAVETGSRVLDLPSLTERARSTALAAVVAGLLLGGQLRRALDLLEVAEQRPRPEVLVGHEFGLEVFHFLAAVFSGRLGEAATRARSAYDDLIERSAPSWVPATWACALGFALRVQGRVADAGRWQDEAISLFGQSDTHGHMALSLAESAHCHALRGHARRAQQALGRVGAASSPTMGWLDGHVAEAKVWTAAVSGELSAAAELALEQARELGGRGLRMSQGALLHHAGRLGAGDRAAGALAEVADQCDSALIAGWAAHLEAASQADPSSLLEASERFEGLEAWLYAAEAAAQAARLWRSAGRRGSALSAAARARTLLERCGDVRTPALGNLDEPLPLTPREREVAGLAARGLTSRQIADRLTLSVRTVDNHLHNVYTKLGIDGRERLAPILLPATSEEAEEGG